MLKITLSSLFLLSTVVSIASARGEGGSVVIAMPKSPTKAQEAAKRMFDESHGKIFGAATDQAAVEVMKQELLRIASVEDTAVIVMGGRSIVKKISDANLSDKFHKVIIDTVAALYAIQIRSKPEAKVEIRKQTTEKDRVLGETLTVVDLVIYPEHPSQQSKVSVKLYYNKDNKLVDISVDNSFRMALTLKTQWKTEWDKSGEDPAAFLENLKQSRDNAQIRRQAKRPKK